MWNINQLHNMLGILWELFVHQATARPWSTHVAISVTCQDGSVEQPTYKQREFELHIDVDYCKN